MEGPKDGETGFEGSLTPQQEAALNDLRRAVVDVAREDEDVARGWETLPDPDRFLLRFLRATAKDKTHIPEFRPVQALKRVLATLRFRVKWDLAYAEFDKIPVPQKYEFFRHIRPTMRWVDNRAGTFVMLERFGLFASNMDRHHLTEDEWVHCFAYNTELVAHTLRTEFKEEPRGIIVIADQTGLGMGIMARLNMVKLMNGVMAAHYPESIQKIMMVHAPWLFERAFSVAKGFMDPITVNKIAVFQDLPVDYIRETFDLSKIPKEYGGDSEIPMPIPPDAAHTKTAKRIRKANETLELS